MKQLKCLGHYIKGKLRLVVKYDFQKAQIKLTANSDSDWAGDKKTRKSTSGGVIRIGSHYIKSWSKGQSTIALSSAEAELYAIIKTASESLGILSILQDWCIPMTGEVMADASAALGIIGRTGLGKLRHIDTSYLWLQQESVKENTSMNKVLGTENPADMNTKGLNGDLIEKFTKMLNMEHREGRADLAPEVSQAIHDVHCKRFNSTSKMITKRVKN